MAELVRRSALAGRPELRGRGHHVAERTDLCIHLLTVRGLNRVDGGAVQLSPTEWLLVEEAGAAGEDLRSLAIGRTALFQDMTSALACIELGGPAAFELLGVSALARGEGGAFTTRIAQLRVTVLYRTGESQLARLLVERPRADYLWEWLAAKLSGGAEAGAS